MAEQTAMTCPACGYDVSATLADEIEECPECGTGLRTVVSRGWDWKPNAARSCVVLVAIMAAIAAIMAVLLWAFLPANLQGMDEPYIPAPDWALTLFDVGQWGSIVGFFALPGFAVACACRMVYWRHAVFLRVVAVIWILSLVITAGIYIALAYIISWTSWHY